MRFYFTAHFAARYRRLSPRAKTQTDKALGFLLRDLRHPSLHAKKYDETRGIWQVRVTKTYRLYFLIEGEAYVLLDVKTHPK
ncbi:MAG: hypothetical protein A2806_04215 [Candidatus Terrybacteria bacterium RIFCSPHIGHO2_01_FULL_48_17]|uniref:Uncharacterized protein n=1 Tax=Candidatus Terrybacteria bacterium RIFCSPHIGHO2_01_FULL_48_17 TaxID=1802362 RepID=A0A1G2PKM6_9BACT|nr:MAG: hypothetical protein A2806_04215 [Candidatus Terrybacteria bacterium RIFCSPHIGHO2_01_FULL_48_17]OHA53723.1 MAG: hypothetical protein A3A30_05120 [Candidatus Terrybacteria bacterium RIFCSPLOWO2_01_FULL_48_14]